MWFKYWVTLESYPFKGTNTMMKPYVPGQRMTETVVQKTFAKVKFNIFIIPANKIDLTVLTKICTELHWSLSDTVHCERKCNLISYFAEREYQSENILLIEEEESITKTLRDYEYSLTPGTLDIELGSIEMVYKFNPTD